MTTKYHARNATHRGIPESYLGERRPSADEKRLSTLLETAKWEREVLGLRIARAALRGVLPSVEQADAFALLDAATLELEVRLATETALAERMHRHGW